MLTVRYDDKTGIVWTTAQGLASPDEFDAHLKMLASFLEKSRARHGKGLHLIDAADSPVQVKESFDHMAEKVKDTIEHSDVSAIVMHSALARMQAKRLTGGQQFCSSTEEAEQWLLSQSDAEGPQS